MVVLKFTYRLSCLTTLPPIIIQRYQHLEHEFMWDGKVPKISRNKLIQNERNGGLNLVDLETKDKALKINWARKIQLPSSKRWATMIHRQMPLKDSKIWYCNIKPKHVMQIMR